MDVTERRDQPVLLVVLSLRSTLGYVSSIVHVAERAGYRVHIRYGAEGVPPSNSVREGSDEQGVSRDPTRRQTLRATLRAVAGTLIFAGSGEHASRYFERAARLRGGTGAVRSLGLLIRWTRWRCWGSKSMVGAIRGIHARLGPPRRVVEDVARLAPSVVLVAGMNKWFRVDDDPCADYLDAAVDRRIPTAALVLSWDNLTTKGTTMRVPDRFLVWNAFHQREAASRHHLPSSRIVEVGAPRYDELCRRVDAVRTARCEEPVSTGGARRVKILYLGSSRSIAGDETGVIEGLLDHLERAPKLDWEMLVRPHPANRSRIRALRHERLVIEGPERDGPASDPSEFFSLVGSATCFIGINTSGFIDAALSGIPGFTLWRHDIDVDGRPSVHLTEMIEAGYVRPVDEQGFVEALIHSIVPPMDHRGLRAGIGFGQRPSAERVVEVLDALRSDRPRVAR